MSQPTTVLDATRRDARPASRETLDAVDGRMWIARDQRVALAAAGLDRFEAVMHSTAGRLLRALPDRENWRLDLPDPHGPPRGAYLKKHHVRPWSAWLRAKLGRPAPASPGRVEAENIEALARQGIAAMRLVAFGERLHADGLFESFVMTEELAGFTQLDHFLRARFTPLNQLAEERAPRDREFDELLSQVAAVARRFHRLGYNHRDLYCCHFFICEGPSGSFRVHLIDLQRVQRRRFWRRRWIVKDLAQLAYSAPRERVSCSRRLAFFKAYLGVRKLRARDKRLLRSVLRKQWLMEFKLGPHP